ncbi:radical SAM protein [Streptomyces sp. NPDC002602]|uniref:radical SAM protein n=1 Tax=Streptomyces sp. NPDC002602 TaxID=3364654 RepID=UPI0036A3FB7A
MIKKTFRSEWFGGFEYSWEDNYISEFNPADFADRATESGLIRDPAENYMPFPLKVNIDTTYFCNKDCIYCHSNSSPSRYAEMVNEISVGDICQIIDDCERMGVLQVALTGGEALLKPGIWEALETVGGKKGMFSSLISNGTGMTAKRVSRIQNSGVSRVSVSLDGFSGANDLHRWKGAYGQTVKGIQLLLEGGVQVGVISVITKHNFRDFKSFVGVLYEMGVRNHSVLTLGNVGRAKKNWMGISHGQFVEFSEMMTSLRAEMAERGYLLTFNDALLARGDKPDRLSIYSFTDAVPGWKCVVRPTGVIENDRVWGVGFPLGNVRTESFYDIWTGSEGKRSAQLKQTYDALRENRLLDVYARVSSDSQYTWDWLSALDNYYPSRLNSNGI